MVGWVPNWPPRRSLLARARARSGLRAFLLSDEPPEWFWRSPGVGQPTGSGVTVTDQTALRVTAVREVRGVLDVTAWMLGGLTAIHALSPSGTPIEIPLAALSLLAGKPIEAPARRVRGTELAIVSTQLHATAAGRKK